MRPYSNFYSAVQDLHERGYTQDFVLFENCLYWTQEKLFVPEPEFIIAECHQFSFPMDRHRCNDLLIFGISLLSINVKGLLLSRDVSTGRMPAMIMGKVFEMEYTNSLARIKYMV